MNSSKSLSPSLLSRCLNTGRIQVQAPVSSRKKLFEAMACLLRNGIVGDVKEKDIYLQLWEREKLGNTGIGGGVALPHARSNQTNEAIIAVITLADAVDYDASDRQAVDLAFGLLVPEQANQEHLNLLAEIARLVADTDKKQRLCDADSAEQIIALISDWTSVENGVD